MEPLSLIYWIKFCLGAFTAVLCLVLNVNNIFTGIVVGALVYAVSNRVLRKLFIGKVGNPSIVTKTGIGIYIITWLFLWILLYSLRYAAVI